MNWKKLLYPPFWLQLILIFASAAGLTAVFVNGGEEHPIAYAIYVFAFYTLTVVSIFCATKGPAQFRRIKAKADANPTVNRFLTDPEFSGRVSLYASFAVNLLYAAVNVVSFYLYRSYWFVCLAIYYTILAVTRFLLVRYVRVQSLGSNLMGELKRSRLCSYIMLLLNLFLSGAVLMIVYQNKGYEYHGMMIYVMALYTFYTTANAIKNVLKYRKFGSPVMATAKMISLAAALVSMLNLETAMFASFGADMSREDQRTMIFFTGAGVSIAVIAMSVYTAVRSTKEIKKIRSCNNG